MAQMTISSALIVAKAPAALLVLLVMPLLSAGGGAVGEPMGIGMPNCPTSCGGVEVPYPFGIGSDTRCYLPGFNLTCDDTSSSGDARLLLGAAGTLQLLDLPDVEIPTMYAQYGGDVKIDVDAHGSGNGTFLGHGPYTLDTGNELILTGCNVQATVKDGNITVASCTSLCQYRNNYNNDDNNNDNDEEEETQIGSTVSPCSGSSTGCCRADIIVPEDYDSQVHTSGRYDVQLWWFGWNRSADLEVRPVRVFIATKEWFDNRSVYTDLLQTRRAPSKDTMAVPVWLRWGAVGHPSSSVCKSNHSERWDGTRRGAYTCHCKDGYEGNPYLIDGCKDTNECKEFGQTSIGCYGECKNTEGSFMCRCPLGTTGNHSIPGGCVSTTFVAPGTCMTWCGKMEVPYPFGIIGSDASCYRPGFGLVCDTALDPSRLFLSNSRFRVISIFLPNNTVRVIGTDDFIHVSPADKVIMIFGTTSPFFPDGEQAPYSLSAGNELILTGCNAQATLLGQGNLAVISGCASFCSHNDTGVLGKRWPKNGIHGGTGGGKYCYGMGCCQARISESMEGMPSELSFKWFDTNGSGNFTQLPAYVFVAEDGWFDHSGVAHKLMRESPNQTLAKGQLEVPLLLQWEILGLHSDSSSANMRSSHPDCNRQEARDLCQSKHSQCVPGNRGYTCQCNDGYHGNPYVLHGCKGGRAKFIRGVSIITGVASGAGLILSVFIAYYVSKKIKHQRAQMLKRKYFEQNRGQLLQQLVSQRAYIAEKMIISLEELEKATNNFDKARELGGGGHGTVYKGILSDLHVVAIKKPKMVVQREIDEFINEVAILSQINHRNVVKLYGCCLETEVPMLVYEFISNGTLYDHLHVEGPISLSWDDRLRIAIETAKSLAYLHSTTSTPIIHRDIKPANILLDDTLTAKVADFGASKYIPLDKSGLTTMVQGTLGYMDPMYFYTWHLTEKSDVYSFGVMLIEMMTRKKPFPYMASEGNGLVAHFSTLFAEGNVMELLDPQVLREGGNIVEEIAAIAISCVKLRGEERPTMRQVELRLEAAQSTEEFEVNGDVAVNSPLECAEGLTSRQYSMEEEYNLSARYPR